MKTIFILIAVAYLIHFFLMPVDEFLLDPSTIVTGKNVVLTGASQGIGRSLAFEYAKFGAKNIVVAARSVERLNNLKEEIEGRYKRTTVHVANADLSSEAAAKSLIDFSLSVLDGGIDYLVLNHITSAQWGLWLKNTEGDFEHRESFVENMFSINAFSYMYCASYAMKSLVQRGGQILIVSSFAGHVGTPFAATYASTKHALAGFFNSLRSEMIMMGIDNVGVTICAIGSTDTEGASAVKEALSKVAWDPPEDAAVSIIKGGALKKEAIYHPHYKIFPPVFINALSPRLMAWILRANM